MRIVLSLLIALCVAELQAQIAFPDSVATDIDGNVYKTVQIGLQIWMAENLRVTHYRNGDPIFTTVPDTLNYTQEVTPKYQWVYGNDEKNLTVYGRLYTWFAAVDQRNACPVGWHLPTIAEFKQLDDSLGGKQKAIGKLKATGTEYWKAPNSDATNESGFNGLPAGWRSAKGHFGALRLYGHWWAADRESTEYVYRMFLSYNEACYKNHLGAADPQTGWSIRCVKN